MGMPRGEETDPTVVGVEVYPKNRLVSANAEQQISVTAIYSDGHTEDAPTSPPTRRTIRKSPKWMTRVT